MSQSRFNLANIGKVRDLSVRSGYNTVSPNRFEMNIAFSKILEDSFVDRSTTDPNDLTNNQRYWSERLNNSLQSIRMPGRGQSTTQVRTHGVIRDVPYEPLYGGDIEMNFIVSHDYFERQFFEKWMDYCVGRNGKYSYYDDFTTEIQISALDIKDEIVYELRLEEAYPKEISAIEYAHSKENELVNLTINMAYRRYTVSYYDLYEEGQSPYRDASNRKSNRNNSIFDDIFGRNIISINGNTIA